jgi:hypothetical protein
MSELTQLSCGFPEALSGGLCMASKTFVLEDIVQRIPTRRPNGSRTYPKWPLTGF